LGCLKLKEIPAMKKKLYRKLRKSLNRLYGKFKKRSFRRRLKLLVAALCGLMRKKYPYMSCLGYGLPQKIIAHSKEKSMKSFLENKWTDYETFYRPFIEQSLQEIFAIPAYQSKIELVMDGSKMGNSHMALMISLRYKNRGIPLVWTVRKKPKGHFSTQVHTDLFAEVLLLIKPFLQPQTQVVFMGDGEFDSPELQDACVNANWNFVFRTSCNSVFYENDDRFQPKDLTVNHQLDFYFVANTEFSKKRRKNVNLVYWHDNEYNEPLPLISDLDEPLDIMAYYRKRYSVEAMFKDMKSTTFNVHKTRLKKAYSISNLIMVAAIALILTIKVGQKYEKSELRPFVNRIRADRKVNTHISFGRDFIDYCLDHSESFNFSYQFSKNSS